MTENELRKMQNQLRFGLSGYDYIGMIEPAHYVNLQDGVNFQGKRCVFWHLHALVWGTSRKTLTRRLRKLVIARKYVPIADGLKATDVREVAQGTLPARVSYMLKSPTKGYRVTRVHRTDEFGATLVDANDDPLRTFKHGKEDLRPGEMIDLFHSMKYMTLDQLAVAGGDGVQILKEIKSTVFRAAKALERGPMRMKSAARSRSCTSAVANPRYRARA